MFNLDVIYSILRRNVQSYFSGVLGYLVIVVFVTVAAFCAFNTQFFAYSLANLDQLSSVFPVLLLALVPAMTMSTWADEKKLGTDEILFTLPATDFEILIGKYLSVLSVYTIAVFFSVTQLFVLAQIGNPDWGVITTTYIGYWLAGAALLSAGMFASVLTGSTTVAYVLGATFCSIPVFIGSLAPDNTFVQSLSLSSQLRDFTDGIIPLTGILYFIGLTVFMLYLNMIWITSRHWNRGEEASMVGHFIVRAMGLAIALISTSFIAEKSSAYFSSRVDFTSENLYTLTDTTLDAIERAEENKRTITIQAFVSEDVPQEYAYARKQLIGLLRQYDRIGGSTIDLRLVSVKPNSTQAKEARTLGIEAYSHRSEGAGKQVIEDVYMGVILTSNIGEEVIEFLDSDAPMEYELTRAMSNVIDRPDRLRVGILSTDALHLGESAEGGGGAMFFTSFIEELETHYEVVEVSTERLGELLPAQDEATDTSDDDADSTDNSGNEPEILIVVQPTSLTSIAMDYLVSYIENGNPVIIMADPLPVFPYVFYRPEDIGVTNSPTQPRPLPDSPISWVSNAPVIEPPPELQAQLMQMQQQLGQLPPDFARQMMENFYEQNPAARPRFEPKADYQRLLDSIGVDWRSGRVAWDVNAVPVDFEAAYPIELLGDRWPRAYGPRDSFFLFSSRADALENPFSTTDTISAGLRDMMFCYPGIIEDSDDSDFEFTPLIRTSSISGYWTWDEITFVEESVQRDIDQRTGRVTSTTVPLTSPYSGVPLVRIRDSAPREADDDSHILAAHISSDDDDAPRNVVFVTDFDFVSDLYFEQIESLDRPLDNMTFVLNAIETLAGDASLVALRNRRAEPRRLVLIQEQIKQFRDERSRQQQVAKEEIREELEKARDALKTRQREIDENQSMGFVQRFGELGEAADVAQQEFQIKKGELEDDLQQRLDDLKATEQQQRERLENGVRFAAVVLPPIPALMLGIAVLIIRVFNEQKRVDSNRRRT